MGVVGERQRLAVTVISDAVNVTSRLESLTKACRTSILVTAAALKQPELVTHRCIGKIQVEGKQQVLLVYEVFASHSHPRMRVAAQLQRGIRLYQQVIYFSENCNF